MTFPYVESMTACAQEGSRLTSKKFMLKTLFGFGLLIGGSFILLRFWQAERKPQSETALKFVNMPFPTQHQYDSASLPFVGSAAFDIDGDTAHEIFIAGGKYQQNKIYKFKDGAFVDMGIPFPHSQDKATHGAAHLDIDKDGDTDLFTAGEGGVWVHINTGKTQTGHITFTSRRLEFGLAENTTPLGVALGDVNKDGWVDLYISGYIKNNLVEGQTIFTKPYGGYSYLLLNNGDNTWRDVSKDAGVWRQHNTFTTVFVDLDNDLDSDLVIAQDTGGIEMYENTGTFPMRPIANPTVNAYPMGLAVGDYNNDGLMDIYASNVGHTLPAFMLRGDLGKNEPLNTDYILLRNDGGLKFTDTARSAGIARFGFGWGTLFADLNIDGHEDLLVAQNYIKLSMGGLITKYAAKVLQNNGNSKFALVGTSSGATNKANGITPLVADFNGDSRPDIIWVNIGAPAKAYLNQTKGLPIRTLNLPNTVHNLGALVHIPAKNGATHIRQIIANQGLGSDQPRTLFLPASEGPPRPLKIQIQSQ